MGCGATKEYEEMQKFRFGSGEETYRRCVPNARSTTIEAEQTSKQVSAKSPGGNMTPTSVSTQLSTTIAPPASPSQIHR
jgi:hypothetical protein